MLPRLVNRNRRIGFFLKRTLQRASQQQPIRHYLTSHHENGRREQANNDSHNYNGWKLGLRLTGAAAILFLLPALVSKKHPNHKEVMIDKPQHRVGKAVIFTWYPKDGCIGHQSMMMESVDGERLYFSFWPSDQQAKKLNFLPFKFMGLGGKFIDNIQGDIKEERDSYPDQVAVVYNLDFDKMKREFHAMKNDVASETMCYSFFPKTPAIMTYINHANKRFPEVSPIAVDPFAETSIVRGEELPFRPETRYHNCTSAIQNLLVAGGYPEKRFDVLPWGASPFGQHFEYRVIGAKVVNDDVKVSKLIEAASEILGQREKRDASIAAPPGPSVMR